MKKAEILAYIATMDWAEDRWHKSEEQLKVESSIAKYVVYQQDMDTYNVYGHEYYMTKEEAMADFKNRTSSENCYCEISEMGGEFRERRTIHRPLAPWD